MPCFFLFRTLLHIHVYLYIDLFLSFHFSLNTPSFDLSIPPLTLVLLPSPSFISPPLPPASPSPSSFHFSFYRYLSSPFSLSFPFSLPITPPFALATYHLPLPRLPKFSPSPSFHPIRLPYFPLHPFSNFPLSSHSTGHPPRPYTPLFSFPFL